MKKTIEQYLESFISEYQDYFFDNGNELYDSARIYNEFTLQHELGFFLRNKLEKEGLRVDFERHEKNFDLVRENIKRSLKKHEIDIVVFDNTGKKYAIELKYPRKSNIAYNINLYSFSKDIEFMEQMKQGGFDETYCLVVSDDPYVYKRKRNTEKGIYNYFRTYGMNDKDIPNLPNFIQKKTKKGKTISYYVDGLYKIIWKPIKKDKHIMYYILKINNTSSKISIK